MSKPSSNTSKRIHSIKHWLDKAEASYEKKDAIKGKIQLLVANAEMQQLQEKENRLFYRRSSWSFIIVIATAALILIGAWGIHGLQEKADTLPSTTVTETKASDRPSPGGQSGNAVPETAQPGASAPSVSEPKSDTGPKAPAPVQEAVGQAAQSGASETRTNKGTAAGSATLSPEPKQATVRVGGGAKAVKPKAPVSEDQVEAAVRLGGRALRGQD